MSTECRRPLFPCAGRSVDARAGRVACAAVRRVMSPRLVFLLSHRRLGSIGADTGDAERAPSCERAAASTGCRRRRRVCAGRFVGTLARRVVCAAMRRVTSFRLVLSSKKRRGDGADAERERVVAAVAAVECARRAR